jgi:plasmid stabilization system protein ParE
MKLRQLRSARKEAHEAARWYEREKPGLGGEFLDALRDALKRIQDGPLHFPPLETLDSARHLRWCLLDRFSYLIVFEVRTDEVLVLAVAHTSRQPNYWKFRHG